MSNHRSPLEARKKGCEMRNFGDLKDKADYWESCRATEMYILRFALPGGCFISWYGKWPRHADDQGGQLPSHDS